MEGNVLFNDALNTFYLRLYCIGYMEGRKEMFYLTTHSTRFIYGYMASDISKDGRKCLFNDALRHMLFTVIWRWSYRRKEMFYLTTHSTHFIYGYMASDISKEERICLFNDLLNTFYLRFYGIGHMEGRKEMVYLTTHSTHFIYAYMASDIWKEGNVLLNDSLNTFYLRLYGIGHMEGRKEMFI